MSITSDRGERTSKIRVYRASPLISGHVYTLSPEEAHYVCHVMRRTTGDFLYVFNAQEGEFLATLLEVQGKKPVSIQVNTRVKAPEILDQRVLGLAFLKPEKFLFCLEKATELGVTEIQPLLTQHGNSALRSESKAHRRMMEAAEQCERCTLPTMHPSQSLKPWLRTLEEPWLVALERFADIPPVSSAHFSQFSRVLIGPEGGFSVEEKDLLMRHPCITPVHLGPLILRSETAVMYMLSGLHGSRAMGAL